MSLPIRPLAVGAVSALIYTAFSTAVFLASADFATSQETAISQETKDSKKVPERMLVEIYRIAPGRHEAFLRDVALFDKANQMAGLPPRQLYVHSEGAGWDFMLIQPASTPPEKSDALSAAWSELDLPSGANFFLSFRKNILEHSDTFVRGPTSAEDFLATLDQ